MRLNHYLSEDIEYIIPQKDKDILQRECSDIIRIYKETNRVLYRGLKRSFETEGVQKIVPRIDRKPTDTSAIIQKRVDEYFFKKFHWKPRSEGVFASSHIGTAKAYTLRRLGVYVIFPSNGFKYVWSPDIEDAYEDIFRLINSQSERYEDDWYLEYGPESKNGKWMTMSRSEPIETKNLEDIKGYVSHEGPTKSNPYGDFWYSAEVEYVDEYGAKEYEIWEWMPDVSLSDYTDKLAIIDSLNTYKDIGIEKCLYGHNEIMIKCKYYYAVPTLRDTTIRQLGLS